MSDETTEEQGAVVAVDLPAELAAPEGMVGAVYSAIDAQRAVAISYVQRVRRAQPAATPAEIIATLERHYVLSVTASGTAVGATAFIPGAGTAIAIGAGAAELLLQFELAALFGLSIAEVHGLDIQDRPRARAVILSLMLGNEGRNKVMALASAAVNKNATNLGGSAGRSNQLANGGAVDLPLAELLGSAVPAELMPGIVSTIQDLAKEKLPEKAVSASTRLVPGGVGMLLGAVGGYTAGSDVVKAAKLAFGEVPEALPAWLEPSDDDTVDAASFSHGMRGAVGKVIDGSGTVVTATKAGIFSAAASVSSPFRKVDLDGDGIPDEARALTSAKRAGSAIKGVAGAGAGAVGGLLKRAGRAEESDAKEDGDSN